MFSVMWRLGQDYWNKQAADKAAQEKADAEAAEKAAAAASKGKK